MTKLHDTGEVSSGGVAYVIMYWLAHCIVAAIVVAVAIVTIKTTDVLDGIL